jgi:hypothetical protein
MGKIILEFDSIEEQDDARTALDGYKWKLAMWDLTQELRAKTKYASDDANPEVIEALYKLREEIQDILYGYGLQLD